MTKSLYFAKTVAFSEINEKYFIILYYYIFFQILVQKKVTIFAKFAILQQKIIIF